MFFGWRARDEHHRVKYGDIKIKCEDGPEGREYVEWTIERGSKTRTAEHEFVPDRKFNPKMFATDGPRCPAKIFKEYLARRPPEMAIADSPLYLASIVKRSSHFWLNTVSSIYIWMGCYNHSISLDATNMVSKNCPVIGEHVVILFLTL